MQTCIFDAHCDTIEKILSYNENLNSNSFHFDVERAALKGDKFIQIFAACAVGNDAFIKVIKMTDRYFTEIERLNNINHCESMDDINKSSGVCSILAIEGGDAIISSIEMLRLFYRLGVRVMTLTWNYSNSIADGIMEKRGAGLSDFGKEVVREMNRLGMMVDVSHLSEKGFWDVSEISDKPFIASHSNARSICSHKRNLTDEQIKEIIKLDGCIGVNFYPVFLSDDENTSILDIMRHIEHILSLGGENNIGFGSDFDGIDCLPDGILGVQSYDKIINEFLKVGYSEVLIKKICSENFLRVFGKVLNNN